MARVRVRVTYFCIYYLSLLHNDQKDRGNRLSFKKWHFKFFSKIGIKLLEICWREIGQLNKAMLKVSKGNLDPKPDSGKLQL